MNQHPQSNVFSQRVNILPKPKAQLQMVTVKMDPPQYVFISNKKETPQPEGDWTKDEERSLMELIKRYGQNYEMISKFYPNRDISSIKEKCLKLTQTPKENSLPLPLITMPPKKEVWTTEEEKILLDFYSQHGTQWNDELMKALPNKSLEEIQKHAEQFLAEDGVHYKKITPTVIKRTSVKKACPIPWTTEEEEILQAKVKELGTNWKEIQKFIPRRQPQAIQSKWRITLKKKLTDEEIREIEIKSSKLEPIGKAGSVPWTQIEKDKLKDAVKEFGEDWDKILPLFPLRKPATVKILWSKLNKAQNESSLQQEEQAPFTEAPLEKPNESDNELFDETKIEDNGDKYVSLTKGAWTQKDDSLLKKLHEEFGNRWARINEFFPNRPIESLRERWSKIEENEKPNNHQESPAEEKEKSIWTKELDEKLASLHNENGNRWGVIIKEFPGLSISEVQAHWEKISPNYSSERRARQSSLQDAYEETTYADTKQETSYTSEWTEDEEKLFVEKLKEHGQNWKLLATFFPTKNTSILFDHFHIVTKPKLTIDEIKQIELPGFNDPEITFLEGKRRPWMQLEMDLLVEKLREYGLNWDKVLQFFPTRKGQQVKILWSKLKKKLDSEVINEIESKVVEKEATESESKNEEEAAEPQKSLLHWTQEEDQLLIEKIKENHGQWKLISASFPEKTVQAIWDRWHNHLKKNISPEEVKEIERTFIYDPINSVVEGRPRQWLTIEVDLLIEKLHEFGTNWAEILPFFPTRAPAAIKHLWTKMKGTLPAAEVSEIMKKSPQETEQELEGNWTEEEDSLLIQLLKENGTNYSKIQESFPEKTEKQIMNHWRNTVRRRLPPNSVKSIEGGSQRSSGTRGNSKPWTQEEQDLLLAKMKEIGPRWELILPLFPNRTTTTVKNLWTKLKKGLSPEELKRIESLVLPQLTKAPLPYEVLLSAKSLNNEWTEGEESLLLTQHRDFGDDWNAISAFFPSRSPEDIERHWKESNMHNEYSDTDDEN